MLEFCQSDTDLLELDPFASIHHINDVIRRCQDEEAIENLSDGRGREPIEDTIFHSAPEVSIFGVFLTYTTFNYMSKILTRLESWRKDRPVLFSCSHLYILRF